MKTLVLDILEGLLMKRHTCDWMKCFQGSNYRLFLALDPERLPFGNGIQALMIIRMIWELIKNSGS